MSANPVGGRSVSSFQGAGQTARTKNVNVTVRPQLEGLLTDEELLQAEQEAQILANAPRIINPQTGRDFPFGATQAGLESRNKFLNSLQASFLGRRIPTVNPGQRRAAQARVDQINENITALRNQTNPFAAAANQPGVFAGDPLDIARSNFDRARSVKIAELTAERDSLLIQTGDRATREKLKLTEFSGATKSFTDSHGFETLGGDRLSGRTTDTLERLGELTPEQQQALDANRKAIQERTGIIQRSFGPGPSLTGTSGSSFRRWYRALNRHGQRVSNALRGDAELNRLRAEQVNLNPSRTLSIEERRIVGGGSRRVQVNTGTPGEQIQNPARVDLSRASRAAKRRGQPQSGQGRQTVQKGASLAAVLNTFRHMISLPQFSGKRGSAPGLKTQINELSKVQAQRADSDRRASERVRLLQQVEADTTLSPSERARRVQDINRAQTGTEVVSNENFEASRAGFASSVVNLNTSRTTRNVQEFIDIGRRIRAQILGDNEQA